MSQESNQSSSSGSNEPISPRSPKSPQTPRASLEQINVKVHLPMSGTLPLNLRMQTTDTVHRMKQVIEQVSQYRLICTAQNIIHDNRLLNDANTLKHEGLKEGSECYLSMRLQTGTRQHARSISRSEAVARSQQPKVVYVKVSSADKGLPAFLRLFSGLIDDKQRQARLAASTPKVADKVVTATENKQRHRTRLRVAKLRDKLTGRRCTSMPALGSSSEGVSSTPQNYTVLGSALALATPDKTNNNNQKAQPASAEPASFMTDQVAVTKPNEADRCRASKSETATANISESASESDDFNMSWTEVDESDYATPAEDVEQLLVARTRRNELGLCAVPECSRRLRQMHWVSCRCVCGLVHCLPHKQSYEHKCTHKYRNN